MDKQNSQDEEVLRTQITVSVIVETSGMTPEQHDQNARWVWRNMLKTNADHRGVFFVAAVRDEEGRLLEFQGAGRGRPSTEIQEVLSEYLEESSE